MRDYGEIWPFLYGMQIGPGGTAATRTFHRVFVSREALLLTTVKVIGQREARLLASFNEAIQQDVVGAIRFFYRERAVVAVVAVIATPFERLSTLEIWQHLIIGPTGVASLCPLIVVGCITAYVNHGINGRRTAPTSTARPVHAPPCNIGVRLGFVAIV